MTPTVRTGVVLGALVVAWTFVMGLTGWYKDPALLNLFFLVVLLEILAIYYALRQTAAVNPYGQQLVTGTTVAAVAAVIIFLGSLLFTTVAFPDYFQELQRSGRELFQRQGLTEEEIARRLEQAAAWQTPVMNALQGVIGTLATGVVTSAIFATWLRKRTA